MTGRALLLGIVVAVLAGCGSRGAGYLDVGGTDAGMATFAAGDAGGSLGALDAYIADNNVAVRLITLSCSGQCATVQAVGTGGTAPYTYAWEDGSTNATRRVCPDATASYWVNVTDTGISGEFPTPPQTVRAALTADVLACPDAATAGCDGGAGPGIPASGLYAGTFYCPPGPDGGIVALPGADGGLITGDFWVDLSVDPSTNQVSGMLYGKWVVLGVIAFQAQLQGTLDCSAAGVEASWVNGEWGLPGPAPDDASVPLTVVPAGVAPGTLTASVVPGSPGAIAGMLTWTQSSSDNGSMCAGTFAATLEQ
jgi:hypothetical protein